MRFVTGAVGGDTVAAGIPWDIDDAQCPPIGAGGAITGASIAMSGSGSCDNQDIGKRRDVSVTITL